MTRFLILIRLDHLCYRWYSSACTSIEPAGLANSNVVAIFNLAGLAMTVFYVHSSVQSAGLKMTSMRFALILIFYRMAEKYFGRMTRATGSGVNIWKQKMFFFLKKNKVCSHINDFRCKPKNNLSHFQKNVSNIEPCTGWGQTQKTKGDHKRNCRLKEVDLKV